MANMVLSKNGEATFRRHIYYSCVHIVHSFLGVLYILKLLSYIIFLNTVHYLYFLQLIQTFIHQLNLSNVQNDNKHIESWILQYDSREHR